MTAICYGQSFSTIFSPSTAPYLTVRLQRDGTGGCESLNGVTEPDAQKTLVQTAFTTQLELELGFAIRRETEVLLYPLRFR